MGVDHGLPGADVNTSAVVGAQRVGRYELLMNLASGGMATVYVGRQRGAGGFERLVAIKRMHPHVSEVEELAAAFLDEARIASQIRHPNVVSVLDVHDAGSERLLVMDYVDGVSLAEVTKAAQKRGVRVQRPAALRVAIDTLHGLHAAHELTSLQGTPLGVVHRDATPHNILIGTDGSVRITDFGIAKAAERSVHTAAGLAKGKFRYMAPEQARGGTLDRRLDVFAVGIVLWELLAGERLFTAETDAEVLMQVSAGEVRSLERVAPDVPAELAGIVMRALAKEPDQRWATAEAFADALREWAHARGELTTAAEVGRMIAEFCGAKIEARRRALESILAGHQPPVRTTAQAEGTGSTAGGPMTVDSVKVAAAVTDAELERRRLRRALTAGALVMGSLALAAAGTLLFIESGPVAPPRIGGQSASVATPTPAPPPARTAQSPEVRVQIAADVEIVAVRAEGATNISFMDERASFDVPRSSAELVVSLELADGSKLEERVLPTGDVTLRVRSVGEPRTKPEVTRAVPRSAPADSRVAPSAARPRAPALEANPYE